MSVSRSARKNRSTVKASRVRTLAALSAATGLAGWALVSRADTFSNNGGTALNSSSSWQDDTTPSDGDTVPGATDIAQFDSLTGLTAPTTFTLGADTSWMGLTILNPGASVIIGNAADSSNTLTLGADGINMSAASQNLTIVDPLAMVVNQSFLVNTAQTLTLNGAINISTATLTFGGGGTSDVNGVISDGGAAGAVAETGTGTVVLTAANNYTGDTSLSSGVMELNFAAAGAPASNILPSAAELRLGGGTLLVNGSASGGSQSFASTETNGSTYVTSGLSTVQLVNNGGGGPTVNFGTLTVNNISTNLGGAIDFTGPATSSDGNGATLVPASGTITVGSTATSTGGLLVDPTGSAFAVVGQANGSVTDFAAVANGVVVGGSTVSGFYTVVTTAPPSGTVTENIDIGADTTNTAMRISSSASYTTLRFNATNSGLYNGYGNNMDQFIIKNQGKTLTTGAILVTSNVGANNVLITQDGYNGSTYLDYQNLVPFGSSASTFNVFQYNTMGALILNTGIHDSHETGYMQAGPGVVELNAFSQTGTTSGFALPAYLNGGLTILGNYAQGGALASASSVNLSGGNLDIDYTGNFDDGFARPVYVAPSGGGLSTTIGNTLTVDGNITGTGVLNIGYGSLQTNEANNTTNLITPVSTSGNGTVILSGGSGNTYTGGTNVNYGTLRLDTASAGTGAITVNGAGTLAGTATLTNNVLVKSGGQLTPGDPAALGPTVGTLGIGSLSLAAGSISNFAFASDTAYSMVDVNGNFTLANGAEINPVQAGSSNPFTDTGNYDLFVVSGSVSLGSAIFGSNAATYSLTTAPDGADTYVVLNVAGSTPETWNTTSGGSWQTAANWYPAAVPNAVGATVKFLADVGNTMTPANGGTIMLNATTTVGTIIFQNANSYTIAQGSGGTLHIQASGSSSGTISDSLSNEYFAVPVSLDSAQNVITVTGATSTVAFENPISGVGAFTISSTSAGTVLFEANNTYGGATVIDGGTLQVGTGTAAGSLGTSTAPIINLGALVIDVSTNQTLSVGPTPAQGTGSLSQNGTGTLTLTGTNNTSGITINAGAIQLGTGAALDATGVLTMATSTTFDLNGNSATVGGLSGSGTIDDVSGGGTPTLTFGNATSTTYGGTIKNTTGTVSLVKLGNGTTTITGANTYTGGTTITSGALIVNQNTSLGSGTINAAAANGLVLGNGVNLSNAITDSAGSAEFEDVVAGGTATLSGNITANGSGQFRVGTSNTNSTLTLTGAATGGTSSIFIITRGNVIVAGNGSIANSDTANALLIGRYGNSSSLNLQLQGNAQLTSDLGVDLGSGTAASDDASITLSLTGNSSINSGGAFNLNDDSNASAGGLSVSLGGTSTLATTAFLDSSTVSGTSTAVTIAGGTITAQASDALTAANTAGSIFLPNYANSNSLAIVSMNIAAGGATINNAGYLITLGQSLGDGGGGSADTVTFTGTGTTVLANANSYAGNTTISAGTVVAANGSGSATGNGTVMLNGGTLASASAAEVSLLNGSAVSLLNNVGSGFISGPVVVGSTASTIAPGDIGSVGTLTLSGGMTTNSFTTLAFDLGTPTSGNIVTNGDLIVLGATSTVGSGTALTFGGATPIQGDDYQLIGGTISGINLSNFVLPGAPAGLSYSLGVVNSYIDLIVGAGPSTLTWDNGAGNNLWNTSSQNWNGGSGNVDYADGDAVAFNDNNPSSTSANYAVTLNSTVKPSSIVVSNSNGNYTISGTGSIAGSASLTKSGTGTLILSTANSYTGGTNVSNGKLIIERTSATTSALPFGVLNITGGSVQLAANVTQGSQSANVPTTAPNSNVNLTSLSITGNGSLDITNNHIIIDYTAGHDPIASIAALIKSGYDNGAWNGPGIVSSDLQSGGSGVGVYGIGYADSADPNDPAGLASDEIEIAYTLLGDANLDGKVNGADFTIMAANFNDAVTAGWDKGDFNYDNAVNGTDFVELADNFNEFASQSAVDAADLQALNTFSAANGVSLTSVPEPATTGLLTLGLIGALSRRRRQRADA